MDMHELWDKTCEKLKAELNRASYQTWIETNLTPKALDGNVLTLKDGGKTLKVTAPEKAVWTIAPAEGPKPLNTPNPGATMVSFALTAGDVDLKIPVNFTVEK